MAAVTMFFLPGTFVSVSITSTFVQDASHACLIQTLFSMVFFNTGTNAAGKTSLLLAPQWWLFPAITIPLTGLVFLIWIVWWRIRDWKTLAGLAFSQEAKEKGAQVTYQYMQW